MQARDVSMSEGLAGWAVSEEASRGRTFPEKRHPYRSDFERDRDRIIHSSAFRRLKEVYETAYSYVTTPGVNRQMQQHFLPLK